MLSGKSVLIAFVVVFLLVGCTDTPTSDFGTFEEVQPNVEISQEDLESIFEEIGKTGRARIIVETTSKNMTIVDETLSTLSENEFSLNRKFQSGRGFHGNITKEGLDNLVKNPNVKAIYYDKIVHVLEE